MTYRDRVPEIPTASLGNVAREERVDRVWKRLQGDLESVGAQGVGLRRSRRGFDVAIVASSAALILFAAGVFVGRAFPPKHGPDVVVEQERVRQAEPAARAEPTPEIKPEPREPTEVIPERQHRTRQRKAVSIAPPAREPENPLAEPVEAVAPAPSPEWHQLWNEDEYQKAREAIERQGGFDATLDQASADQAMAMVDLARFSHENALAIAALRRVVERYPSDPNAPIAALTLGNMLERAGDTKGAAEAFEAYRALSPRGDFVEDALARQFEAALEQRDSVRARELLTQYEEEFPSGSRIEELRAQLREAEETVAEEPNDLVPKIESDETEPENGGMGDGEPTPAPAKADGSQ